MIIIDDVHIKNIPVLQVVQKATADNPLPIVVYYHGFNGEKESSLTIAYKMAEKGIRVILPDAPLHGERALSEDPVEHGTNFWEIVLQAIDELKIIKAWLEEESILLSGQLGIGGTSMGGMITYAALSKYDFFKAAAVLMGTPFLTERAKATMGEDDELLEKVTAVDLTTQINRLNERPLFIWHGEKDEIVPVEDSRNFYEMVKVHYKTESNVQFIEEKDRIHNISKLSIKKTAEWFDAQL